MSQWNRQADDVDLEDESLYPQRPPTSAIRYRPLETRDRPQQAVSRPRWQEVRQPTRYDEVNYYVRRRPPPQGAAPRQQRQTPTQERRLTRQPEPHQQEQDADPETEQFPRHHQQQRPRFHWLVYLGLGMVAILLVWLGLSLLLTWWQGYQDDLHYGRPRTYQMDARVGHNDANTPSHFLALNLNGHMEVIEFPGGDASHTKVYQGPTFVGDGSDLEIVMVHFKDVNGDGKPDLILSVKGATYVFINDQGAFRPLHPDEQVSL